MRAARPKKKRAYRSDVRDAQREQTRFRILETTKKLLLEEPDALTLPRVAAAAGVAVPTVYRHFETVPDLLAAFLEWLRPQLGMTVERLLGSSAETVLELPAENFPRFEEHGALLRALIDSQAFNRVRHGSVGDRAKRAAALFAPMASEWKPHELECAVGAIYALGTPQTWRWLRDTWGLDPARAMAASQWGMRVLADGLTRTTSLKSKPKTKAKGGDR